MAPNLVSSAFEKMFSLEIVENKNDIYLGGASKQMPFFKKNNNNNVHFNSFILAGQGQQFLLLFTLAISFNFTHPLFSTQATLFQILLYTLFPQFLSSTFLPFPSYFNFHNLKYLGTDVSKHEKKKKKKEKMHPCPLV